MSIRIENLSFSYGDKEVLNNISLEIKEGMLTSIIGPNGVGKSTLFKCLLGINKKYSGNVYINGQDIRQLGYDKLSRLIAYIPQANYTAFNYSVLDMVLMGMTAQIAFGGSPKKKHIDFAKECMEKVGILHLSHRNYGNLSGGEQQLVLVARALAQNTKTLIMDEPTSNMDYGNQIKVLRRVKELTKLGYTILQSTHNPDQAFIFSEEVIAIKSGRVLEFGEPNKVITEELITNLYNIDVTIESLQNDKIRVCIPKEY